MSRVFVLALLGLFLFPHGSLAEPVAPPIHDLDVEAIPRLATKLPVKNLKAKEYAFGSEEKGWIVRVAPAAHDWMPAPNPAVAHGRVIVSASVAETRMYGLDVATGKTVWTTRLNDNGPTAAAVRDRTVAVNTQSCTTYTLDAVTGKRKWGRWVGPNVNTSPAISEGRVFAAHSLREGFALSAMSERNGKVLWRKTLETDIHGAPVVAHGRIYVSEVGGRLLAFTRTGKRVLEARVHAASAPWVDAKGIFLATRIGSTVSLTKVDAETGRVEWRRSVRSRVHSTRTGTATRVREPAPMTWNGWAADPPRPVVIGDRAFLARGRDLVACDADTGELVFGARLPVGGTFHAPPAVLGKNLLYGTLDGLLVEIDTTVCAVRRAFRVGHRIISQPVVAQGRAYVIANGCVICVPWGKAGDPEWPQWGGTATRSTR